MGQVSLLSFSLLAKISICIFSHQANIFIDPEADTGFMDETFASPGIKLLPTVSQCSGHEWTFPQPDTSGH